MTRELRYDEDGELDEIVTDEPVHVECMSDSQILLIIGHGDHTAAVMFSARYSPIVEWVRRRLERIVCRFDRIYDRPRLTMFVEHDDREDG